MVLVIIGVVLAFAVPALDRLTPKHTLRAAGREVASTIDLARGTAIGKARRMAIRYWVQENAYALYGPATEDAPVVENVWRGVELARYGKVRTLPAGVRFLAVQPIGLDPVEGELWVHFDPLSLRGSHIVYLENQEGRRFSVKYSALTGSAELVEGEARFETAE